MLLVYYRHVTVRDSGGICLFVFVGPAGRTALQAVGRDKPTNTTVVRCQLKQIEGSKNVFTKQYGSLEVVGSYVDGNQSVKDFAEGNSIGEANFVTAMNRN